MKKYTLLILSLSLCFHLVAQDYFKYPVTGNPDHFPFPGQRITVNWNSTGSAKHLWHELYWWDNPANATIQSSSTLYKHKVDSQCDKTIPDDKSEYSNYIPCVNWSDIVDLETLQLHDEKLNVTHHFQVKFQKRSTQCISSATTNWGGDAKLVVKVPIFPPPIFNPNTVYACPDGSYSITVDVLNDIAWDTEPDFVIWRKYNPITGEKSIVFKDILNGKKNSTLNVPGSGTTTIPEGMVYQVYTGIKTSESCEIYGGAAIIPVLPASNFLIHPPKPQIKFTCTPQKEVITITNDYDYDGVYWYKNQFDVGGTNGSFHQGFSYEHKPTNKNAGETTYWVEYYVKPSNSTCEIRSQRTPINIISSGEVTYSDLAGGTTIYDYRDFNQVDCESAYENPITPFYVDLPKIDNSIVTTIGNQIEDIYKNLPCAEITLSNISSIQWVAKNGTNMGISHYRNNGNSYRVCADNITDKAGIYGFKSYELLADITLGVSYCSPAGELITYGNQVCSITLKGSVYTVRTREPGTINKFECGLDSDVAQLLIGETNNNCDDYEIVEVCENGKEVEIGPTQKQIEKYFFETTGSTLIGDEEFTYSWTPSSGLSNPTIGRPTISYSRLIASDGSLSKYRCTVKATRLNGLVEVGTYNFCSFVYKCSSCSTFGTTPSLPFNNI